MKFPFKLPRRVEIDGRDGGRRPQLSHVGRFFRNAPRFSSQPPAAIATSPTGDRHFPRNLNFPEAVATTPPPPPQPPPPLPPLRRNDALKTFTGTQLFFLRPKSYVSRVTSAVLLFRRRLGNGNVALAPFSSPISVGASFKNSSVKL